MTVFEASMKFTKTAPINDQIKHFEMNVLLMKSQLERAEVKESWVRHGFNDMSILATLTDNTKSKLTDLYAEREIHNLIKKIRIVKNWN